MGEGGTAQVRVVASEGLPDRLPHPEGTGSCIIDWFVAQYKGDEGTFVMVRSLIV